MRRASRAAMSAAMGGALRAKVALVAGATRGTGRGIAEALGEAGATVYCTGRSTRADPGRGQGAGAPFDLAHRPETIEETAERVTALGGEGIAVKVDHLEAAQVEALAARIRAERGGLDVLVNDVWGGDALIEFGAAAWELEPDKVFRMVETVLRTHVLTLRHALPLLLARGAGLVVEVTDGDFPGYRGMLGYDLAKVIPVRLALAVACDLRARGHDRITALAVTPGYLRSEGMLDLHGVTEETWREAAERVPFFSESETPRYVGRGVAALAADPGAGALAGQVLASWTLARRYGHTDLDGRQPDFHAVFSAAVARISAAGPASEDERQWLEYRRQQLEGDPAGATERQAIAAALARP
ncbi:MAG: SDR family oxidoreductase [Anaeromyxobacter sp.]